MGEKRVINRNGKRESWLASISSVFHSKGFSFFFFFKISIVINYPASPGKGWILNKANEKTAKKNNDTVGDDIYRTATIPPFIHAQKYVEFWLLGHY